MVQRHERIVEFLPQATEAEDNCTSQVTELDGK